MIPRVLVGVILLPIQASGRMLKRRILHYYLYLIILVVENSKQLKERAALT